MRIAFWGVRGYVPTPGAAYLRYGGNTCCTAIYGAAGELVVLDSGTGFCQLGDMLMEGAFGRGQGELTLLISHTYWDHILGLPFPGLVHTPGNRLHIHGPDNTRGSLEMTYNGMLSPIYSPVYGLEHIAATHTFQPIAEEPFAVGGLTVRALPLSHRAHSPIWAYRVEEGGRSVVYITDVRYTDDRIWAQAVRFAHGANTLIHSAPYMRGEPVQDFGHSRVEDAIELALEARAERLFLFHHAPTRTDEQIHELVQRYCAELADQGSSLELFAAREGLVEEI
jgi:phosphoribosyl 1,2-cyclic phosphodiesterase